MTKSHPIETNSSSRFDALSYCMSSYLKKIIDLLSIAISTINNYSTNRTKNIFYILKLFRLVIVNILKMLSFQVKEMKPKLFNIKKK